MVSITDLSLLFLFTGGKDGLVGFPDFIYKHIVPACFLAPLKPTFDLSDAQTVLVSLWSIKPDEIQNRIKLCVIVANLFFSDLVRVYTDAENDSSQEGESKSCLCKLLAYYNFRKPFSQKTSQNHGRNRENLIARWYNAASVLNNLSRSRGWSLFSFCSRNTCPLCKSHLRSHRYLYTQVLSSYVIWFHFIGQSLWFIAQWLFFFFKYITGSLSSASAAWYQGSEKLHEGISCTLILNLCFYKLIKLVISLVVCCESCIIILPFLFSP